MWYSLLINLLLVKVKSHQRVVAQNFVQDLLYHIQSSFADNELSLEFLLGVVDKSFVKFGSQDDDSIDAANFNQYMFGLMIIYLKQADEQTTFNSDFIEFFLARLLDMDVYNQFKQFALDYRDGSRLFVSNLDYTAAEQAACLMINNFEYQVLHDLNHQLAVNFSHVSRIFLRAQSTQIVYLFFQQISSFKNIYKTFDDYIKYIWRLGFQDANLDEVAARYKYLKINKLIQPSEKKINTSWYILLLDLFIKKIDIPQQLMVKNLIDDLVRNSLLIFANKELDLEFLAGVIIKAYQKFGKAQDSSIDGARFSRYLFGLIIAYAKMVDETRTIKNNLFINILLRHSLVLDSAWLPITDRNLYEQNCYIINEIEREILTDLNYQLTIELVELVTICQNNWSFDIVYSLYQVIVSYTDTSDSFNHFIRSIGDLLIPPSKRGYTINNQDALIEKYPRISFFSKPLIEVSYENTPHMMIKND